MPETALSDSEDRIYRCLVERGRGLMCVHDEAGTLVMINPAAAESLGYRPDQLVGKPLRLLLDPAVRSDFDDYLRRIWDTGRDSGLMRLSTQDGRLRIWAYRNFKHHEPGLPPLVWGHAQDVTEETWQERSLRRRDERYRAFFSASSEGIARLAFDQPLSIDQPAESLLARALEFGYVAECNEALAGIYGATSVEGMIGAPIRNFTMFDKLPYRERALAFIRDGFRDTAFDVHVTDVNGSQQTILTNLLGIVAESCLECLWALQREITGRQIEELAGAQHEDLP